MIDSTPTEPVTEVQRPRFSRWLLIPCLLGLAASGYWGLTKYRQHQRDEQRAELKETCRQLTSDERWEDLENVARQWTEWEPETDDGWLYYADARLQQGDPVAAQELLQKLPDDSEKTTAALLLASELQLGSANRPLEAPATLKRLIRLRPSLITAQQRLIFFYALTLQRNEMLRQIREAIEARTEPREAYVYLVISSQLSFSNGFSLTSHWLQSDPDSEVLQVARAVHFSDTLDNAADPDAEPEVERRVRRENLVRLLNKYPENRALLRYFLNLKIKEFEVEAVGKLLEQIPPEATDDSLFWRYRGWYHAQRNELEEAERAYRQSLKLDPLEWQTWYELAGVLRLKKELDEAERLQEISVIGKDLRKELMQMPDVAAVTPELLARIQEYAMLCGDTLVADSIAARLFEIQNGPPSMLMSPGLIR